MSDTDAPTFPNMIRWLAGHAGFPARRLDRRAETMLCVAALAAEEETQARNRFALRPNTPAQVAALKAHALRRSRVHYKADNSAKV